MSIMCRSDDPFGTHPNGMFWNGLLPPEAECFFCGSPVTDVAIHWMGKFELYLHPLCSQQLTVRLTRDFWDWDCKRKDMPGGEVHYPQHYYGEE